MVVIPIVSLCLIQYLRSGSPQQVTETDHRGSRPSSQGGSRRVARASRAGGRSSHGGKSGFRRVINRTVNMAPGSSFDLHVFQAQRQNLVVGLGREGPLNEVTGSVLLPVSFQGPFHPPNNREDVPVGPDQLAGWLTRLRTCRSDRCGTGSRRASLFLHSRFLPGAGRRCAPARLATGSPRRSRIATGRG